MYFLADSLKSLFIFSNHPVYALLRAENMQGVVVKDAGRDAAGRDKCKVPSYTKAYPMVEIVCRETPWKNVAFRMEATEAFAAKMYECFRMEGYRE